MNALLTRRTRHATPAVLVSVNHGRLTGRWTAYARPADDPHAPWVQVTRQQLLDLEHADPAQVRNLLAGA